MTRTGTEIFYCELKACHPAYYIVSPNQPGDLDEADVPLPETCAHVQIVKNLLFSQNSMTRKLAS